MVVALDDDVREVKYSTHSITILRCSMKEIWYSFHHDTEVFSDLDLVLDDDVREVKYSTHSIMILRCSLMFVWVVLVPE